MKPKRELLEYAIKMQDRGDSYTTIFIYLNKNCEDEKTVEEIISTLREREKYGLNNKPKKESGWFDVNVIGSVLIIVFGAILMNFLWGKGYVSTLPFIMIGMGLFMLSKSMSN